MLNEFDVYCIYRKAQANAFNRPFKLPKNWDLYFSEKLNSEQRENLRKMTRFLATKWSNIDIHKYFTYGFELWKSFSYHQWFKTQLINFYIQKEKNLKLLYDNLKKNTIKSAKFIKKFNKDNDIKSLEEYSKLRDGDQHLCIKHYIQDNICVHFLVYIIYKRYVILNDLNRLQIPIIVEKYRDIRNEVIKELHFFKEIEEILKNKG